MRKNFYSLLLILVFASFFVTIFLNFFSGKSSKRYAWLDKQLSGGDHFISEDKG